MSDPDRTLSRLSRTVTDAVLENVGRVAGRIQERRPLQTDLLESGDAYRVVVDAPGADAHDIDVRYLDGSLRVTIERFREYREGYSMRFPGRGLTLRGTVALPPEARIDPEAATAELRDDGTLHVTLPKRNDADDSSEPIE